MPFTRRHLLATGAAGLTAAVAIAPKSTAKPTPNSEVAIANTSSGNFAGKVVLITGATSGIGKATAEAFAKQGANVYFCGRRAALGAQVERDIRSTGGSATYQETDTVGEFKNRLPPVGSANEWAGDCETLEQVARFRYAIFSK
ncbi:SDR family NAD(P)-dependent oxidoreductase [Chamaesiphon minutus]|uniref:Short-chain alcohol dehydrogenase n=1 Tax=Chamaesiphon minutus (strain ATCC 27169 / PCC 6605) TaxID=1173020 RepID=K9UN56_CHAP6|nr:SDR family NAD(P)-dependent oxidoreductase [Chamaesiphon minutus]AFY96537.1 short-chain alcohol dehydrogenase [Chamaesiphon minutus PCC 6605]